MGIGAGGERTERSTPSPAPPQRSRSAPDLDPSVATFLWISTFRSLNRAPRFSRRRF
jgi:hypothetical protein